MYRNLREFGRGIIGGLLFGIPIIYTMEVWWTGFLASPEKLLVFVIATFILLLGYNKFAGMRQDASFAEICRDSVEEIGLAFIIIFLFLWLIGRINMDMPMYEILGKTIVESMIMAIGISVGTAQLGQKSKRDGGMTTDTIQGPSPKKRNDYAQVTVLSLCGATFIASSVAPTDEIVLMGIQSSPIQLLLMVIVGILLSTITLYFSDFRGTIHDNVDIQIISIHVLLSYLVAIFVSVSLLWFFGRFDDTSFQMALAMVIVLSIPAVLGASAGRLLIANHQSK